MAKLGLLGYAAAGALKGAADTGLDLIKMNREFDLKKQLIQADGDMRARLEQNGIQAKQRASDEERGKVKGIIDSVKDPNEGKGGYETDEMKAASNRSRLEGQSKALREAGYLDEADKIDGQLGRMDKSAAQAAGLDIKRQQVDNAFEQGKEKLRLQGEANDAKAATAQAKIEAANARAESAGKGKETDTDKEYNAYVSDVKANGRPDNAGKKSYIPMSRDKWAVWNRNQDAGRRQKAGTRSVKSIDDEGNEITTTTPIQRNPASKGSDPLGLFNK